MKKLDQPERETTGDQSGAADAGFAETPAVAAAVVMQHAQHLMAALS